MSSAPPAASINPHVFREYDIRGVADRDFGGEFARDLGRAIGTYLARRRLDRVALGRDCRLSSPTLRDGITKGLTETGRVVVDIGVVPTPLLYFAVHRFDLDGGVMITGSHNPPAENGFKVLAGKDTLYGPEIQVLKKLMEQRDFVSGKGRVETRDAMEPYLEFIRQNLQIAVDAAPKVVIDAGNGAAGPLAVAAFHAVGLDPVQLFCEMDGTFPNHHPDPTDPESMRHLSEAVASEGAQFGIAYDGDGDRIGVVYPDPERGGAIETLYGDKLLLLFARRLLRQRPGSAVIGEVKCSQVLFDDVAAHGGKPILWKTGHSLIKAKMKETGALLAGEMSGHMFFADRYYGFDDAIYASLRLLEIVSTDKKTIPQLLADVPRTFATPEIRIDCPDEKKFEVVRRILERFKKTHKVVDVDGARVLWKDGWGLVRASNTQPVLVLRFEAVSGERLRVIRREVEQAVREAQRH